MKRLRLFLLIIGMVCLFLGIVFAVSASDVERLLSLHKNLTPEGIVYVQSGTCYTCHETQLDNRSRLRQPLLILDPITEPNPTLLAGALPETARMVEDWGENRPFTLEDLSFSTTPQDRQRYVIVTQDGNRIIPPHWDVKLPRWIVTSSNEMTTSCAGCHNLNIDMDALTFSEVDVTCIVCHVPVQIHIEDALLIRTHRFKARFTNATF